MYKLVVFDRSLNRLNKIKSFCLSIKIIDSVRIIDSEAEFLRMLKSEYFDFFILDLYSEEIKIKILKTLPDIVEFPVIDLSGTCNLQEFKNITFYKTADRISVINFVSSLKVILPEDLFKTQDELYGDYIALELTNFKKLNKAPCDLFLQLGKDKFVKIINQDEELSLSIIERYQMKGAKSFFVKRNDYYDKSSELVADILPKESKFQNKIDYYNESQEFIKELIADIGLSENVVQVTNQLIEQSLKELKTPEFNLIFEKFKNSKERYIFDHSSLTAMFAISLCDKFEWRNQQVLQKITFASMFHDFGFINQKLATLDQNKEEVLGLPPEHKKEILNHAEAIHDILAKNKDVSSEVLNIVLKHHEGDIELGYPSGISSLKLSVLECLFIVAHELSNELYRYAFRKDKFNLIYKKMSLFLDNGNFKQVKAPFEEVFKDLNK